MQPLKAQPDPSPFHQIVMKNQLKLPLNITDFQFFEGHRYYKVEWVQAIDRHRMFKWESLQNLQPYIQSIIDYQDQNASFIEYRERQWQQYFLDGQVKQPLEYFNRKKFVLDDEEMPEDSDSDYQVKVWKRKPQKNVQNSKVSVKEVPKPIKKAKANKKAKQLQSQKSALDKEFLQYFGNWSIQIPYIQLSETPVIGQAIKMPEEQKLLELGNVKGKKEATELLSAHSNSEIQHLSEQSSPQQVNESEGQEWQRKPCHLFSSSESNYLQESYEQVVSEESFNQRPSNIRRFIKQQMMDLHIHSPAQILDSEAFANQNQSQNSLPDFNKAKHQKAQIEVQNSCKLAEEMKAEAIKEDWLDRMEVYERIENRKDDRYRYLYENLLSAEIFKHYPLPVITRLNSVITYGSLTLYSVTVSSNQKQSQKFVLQQIISQFYSEILEQYDSDS